VEFVEIYEPLIARLARRNGLQQADVDDLTQEVLRTVAGAIAHWDPDPSRGSFRAWLFRITRNLILNLLAARKRQTASYGTGDSNVVAILEAHPAPESEETALFEAEYHRRVFAWAAERVRGQFHPTTWQAFWRTGVDGHDVRNVAQSLGLSPGAIYVARSRVMARLRREIEEIEGTE
jgi:RNA polymerase sigma-70 factor (ECF subfamily)